MFCSNSRGKFDSFVLSCVGKHHHGGDEFAKLYPNTRQALTVVGFTFSAEPMPTGATSCETLLSVCLQHEFGSAIGAGEDLRHVLSHTFLPSTMGSTSTGVSGTAVLLLPEGDAATAAEDNPEKRTAKKNSKKIKSPGYVKAVLDTNGNFATDAQYASTSWLLSYPIKFALSGKMSSSLWGPQGHTTVHTADWAKSVWRSMRAGFGVSIQVGSE